MATHYVRGVADVSDAHLAARSQQERHLGAGQRTAPVLMKHGLPVRWPNVAGGALAKGFL